MRPIVAPVLSCAVVLACATGAAAATVRATYLFGDTLAAQEASAPALEAVDPRGLNAFESATVYGQARRVYRWDGNGTPATEQAGLSLATSGLIPPDDYSVELVFAFLDAPDWWRRILDVRDRTSDDGVYVDPDRHLYFYSDAVGEGGGTTPWTNGVFHHVVLTVASTPAVTGYLDGVREFTVPTAGMRIENPGGLLHFFLDNVTSGPTDDFSDGRVALIRVYDGVLTDSQVGQLAQDPFQPPLALQLNATTFRAGDPLVLAATLTPGGLAGPVDAYVLLEPPDGTLLSLTLAGTLVPGIVPIASGLTPFPFTGDLLRYTLTGLEPVGTYTWRYALTEAGTADLLPFVAEIPFTVVP
jgi:hypothetical protein